MFIHYFQLNQGVPKAQACFQVHPGYRPKSAASIFIDGVSWPQVRDGLLRTEHHSDGTGGLKHRCVVRMSYFNVLDSRTVLYVLGFFSNAT